MFQKISKPKWITMAVTLGAVLILGAMLAGPAFAHGKHENAAKRLGQVASAQLVAVMTNSGDNTCDTFEDIDEDGQVTNQDFIQALITLGDNEAAMGSPDWDVVRNHYVSALDYNATNSGRTMDISLDFADLDAEGDCVSASVGKP